MVGEKVGEGQGRAGDCGDVVEMCGDVVEMWWRCGGDGVMAGKSAEMWRDVWEIVEIWTWASVLTMMRCEKV